MVMVLGALSGCVLGRHDESSGWDATPWPETSSSTPSPTPTSTSAPKPVHSVAMDTVDTNGAIAVAEYFMQLYSYAYSTGDLTEWKAMSHPECIYCASVVTNVTKQSNTFAHQEGSITMNSATCTEVAIGEWFSVDIDAVSEPWAKLDPVGNIIDQNPDRVPIHMSVIVIRDANGWLIREVDVEKING